MDKKVLHVFNDQLKFSKNYFNFLNEQGFDLKNHFLFHYGKESHYFDKLTMPYLFSGYFSLVNHIKLYKMIISYEKIFIHNFASPWLLLFFFFSPKLIKKCYWVIWGKDLYYYKLLKKKRFYHRIYEFFRKKVFKRIKHIVTHVYGDALLAKKWYQVEAQWHECFMYPNNLYSPTKMSKVDKNNEIYVMVGNSADPSNNHLDVFKQMLPWLNDITKVFVPLSYGDKAYAQIVDSKGAELLSDKFFPIYELMDYDKYIEFLMTIDVAIFGHKRQQAMGNITTLLGMQKKIYIRDDITSWSFFSNLGIKLFNLNNLASDNEFSIDDKLNNEKIIKTYFSSENLKLQLMRLFK